MNGLQLTIRMALACAVFASCGCQMKQPIAETLGSVRVTPSLGTAKSIDLTPDRRTLASVLAAGEPSELEQVNRKLLVAALEKATAGNPVAITPENVADNVVVVRRNGAFWYFPKSVLSIPEIARLRIKPSDSIYTNSLQKLAVWTPPRVRISSIEAGLIGQFEDINLRTTLSESSSMVQSVLQTARLQLDSIIEEAQPDSPLPLRQMDTIVLARNTNGESHFLVLPQKPLLSDNGLGANTLNAALKQINALPDDKYIVVNLNSMLKLF